MANFGTAYIDVAGNFAPLEAEINGLASGPIGKKMTMLGKSLTRNLTLPIVGVGVAAAKLSMDFQRSMTLVETQAGGTKKEVKGLGDAILNASAKGRFTQSTNELAQGLFHIESTGARGKKAWKDLKATADLATIGNANYEATTNAVVGVQKTQIKGTENLRKEIGLLNAGIGVGNLKMEDLNAAVGTGFVGSSKALGLSLQDDLAALGELTSQSVPANAAATRLRMTFSLLANPTTKAKDVLKEIGIGGEDLAKKMRQPDGVVKALELLQEHMQGLSKIEQNQLLSAAFGGAKSGGTLLQLLENVGDLNKKYVELGKNAGNVKKDLEETNKDPEVKLQRAWRRIEATLQQLGAHILPIVVPMFEKVAGFIDKIGEKFGGLSPSFKKLVVEIGFFVAALGPGLTIAGKLVGTFTTLVSTIKKAAVAMGLLDAASAGSGAAGTARGIIGSVAGGAGAGGAARWLGTEGSQAAFMAAEAKAAGQMTERQALAAQGGIFAGLEGGVAGGAGVGAFGGLFKSSGGIRGAGQVLGRTILGVAGGYITAEIGVHGLKALGVGDPTEGQGIAKGLFHGFNTGKMGTARTEAEGTELVKSRLFEVKLKLSTEAAKKLASQYRGLMHSLQSDSILGIKNINHDLAQGLQTASTIWGRNTPEWHQKTAQAMQAAVKSIREGMKSGAVDAKQGQKEINNLLAKIHLVKGDDPFGLAQATTKSFKEVGAITAGGVKQWEQKLALMPKGARESSQQSTLQMLRAWAQGHPKIEAQVNQLTSNLITKFGATNKQLREGVKKGATGPVAQAFKGLAGGVGGSLQNIGVNVQQVLKALGVKNIPQFQIAVATGGGSKFTPIGSGEVGTSHRAAGGPIGFTVPGVGDGDKFHTALPPGSFILNRKAAEAFGFARGGLMPVALEARERAFFPHEVAAMGGAKTLEAMNRAVPRFAKGGHLGPEPKLTGGLETLRSLGQAAIHQVYQGAQHYLAKHKPKMGGLGGLNVPTGPIQQMARQMVLQIWGKGQWAPFVALENREAGWNPQALNPESGAAGLAQALPPSKYPAGAWPYRGLPSAKKQLKWMMGYIKERYGSPSGAWAHEQSAGWYQHGGLVGLQGGGQVILNPGVNMSTGKEPEIRRDLKSLSDRIKKKIYVISGYRSPAHSVAVGGFANDPHTRGEAADIGVGAPTRESASSLTEAILHAVNLDRPFYPESAVEINHVQLWHGGSGSSSSEHSFKEDVPAVYRGCRTDSINFPSMPKSLHGVERELKRWEGEIEKYRRTVKIAQKANKPGIAQALEHNVTAIFTQLNKLRTARRKLRFEKAKKALAKRLNKKLGKFARYEVGIEGLQRDFNIASQFAEQVVGLEPSQPELPASATDAQREAAEKDYVARFTDYVNGRERPAYEDVLGKAGTWRNAILQVEDIVHEQEWTWEGGIRHTDAEIDRINDFTQKVAEHLATFRKDHPNTVLPDWLTAQIKQRDALRGKLPWLRVEDQELRKSLGEARGEFFAGGKDLIKPPALPLAGSGALEEHLTEVQGIHWPDQHNLLSSLPAGRVAGMFGGAIWDTQTTIEELGLKISQAASGLGGGNGGEGEGDSERASLLEELLRQANQRTAVSEAQKVALEGWDAERKGLGMLPPWGGVAHTGAIVPGPPTQERTMVVKGREGIFTEEQMAAMGAAGGNAGPPTIEHLEIHADGRVTMRYEGREFEAAVERVTRKSRGIGVLTPGGARR